MKLTGTFAIVLFLIAATTLEVCGDALVRRSIHEYTGIYRIACMVAGGLLLLGYGTLLNLAPTEFDKVVGMYIAILFIVWQTVNFFISGQVPTMSILVGGALIIAGGLVVTFGKF